MEEDLLKNQVIENLNRSTHKMIREDLGLAGTPASSFNDKDFSGKRFRNNNFEYTVFENCNLSNADFSDTNNLQNAQFLNTNVQATNFRGTKVKPEQFLQAINAELADFDNPEKMLAQIEKLRKQAIKGELNQDSILYKLYRYFVRILGGNIQWYTAPIEGTRYIVPTRKDTNKVVDLAIDLGKDKAI